MKFSKMIGAVVGAVGGILISLGFPEALAGDAVQGAVIVVASAVATYLFPANV